MTLRRGEPSRPPLAGHVLVHHLAAPADSAADLGERDEVAVVHRQGRLADRFQEEIDP